MNGKGIRTWGLLGALAAVTALGTACNENGRIKEGTDNEGVSNTSQPLDTFQDSSATGGSGAAGQTVPAAPNEKMGAQGHQGGIGAPGFSTPRESTEGSDLFHDEPVKGESLDERNPDHKIEGPGSND
jgi:hypothetical protein